MIIIVSLFVVGCGKASASDLEDTQWVLESYGEQGNLQPLIEETRITAIFDSTEKQVHGSAGCNSYFGDYQINDKLSIPWLANTEMACLDPEGVMDQEYEYLKTLRSAESYQIQNGKLQINCDEQKILIYTAETQEEASTTTKPESKGVLLPDELIRDCQHKGTSGDFRSSGLVEGETAIDFTLQDIHGRTVSLSGLLSEKPVLMVFGSFT